MKGFKSRKDAKYAKKNKNAVEKILAILASLREKKLFQTYKQLYSGYAGLGYIRTTKTTSFLKVKAHIVRRKYKTGEKLEPRDPSYIDSSPIKIVSIDSDKSLYQISYSDGGKKSWVSCRWLEIQYRIPGSEEAEEEEKNKEDE